MVKVIQLSCTSFVVILGVQFYFGVSMSSLIGSGPSGGGGGGNNIITGQSGTGPKISILFSTSTIDKEYQLELLKAVYASLRDLDTLGEEFVPDFVELSSSVSPVQAAHQVWGNRSLCVISLLCETQLSQFASAYESIVQFTPRISSGLKIFTPRLVDLDSIRLVPSIEVFSVQMNKRALSLALLNRVAKVGINTLIPVLDTGDESQVSWLKVFEDEGRRMGKLVGLTAPIFIDKSQDLASFRQMLDEYEGIKGVHSSHPSPQYGVLLIASHGSRVALRVAAEKRHMQMGWFSPNILEHEEWAYDWRMGQDGVRNASRELWNMDEAVLVGGSNHTFNTHLHFGLYTVSFVGSSGWDNPDRRRTMRELTQYSGASPRILGSVLAYDSASVAVNHVRNIEEEGRVMGLSGDIEFDIQGHRKDGVFFGVSAVPELASPTATLLQPSTWILEDTTMIKESRTTEGRLFIRDFQVATSSLLTGSELRTLANRTRVDVGCTEHIMNLITHDPFNQMPYNYYFKEENLPENLLIPNQHGFGITFLCFHGPLGGAGGGEEVNRTSTESSSNNDPLATTLQIACTPGVKSSDPIECFRSHVQLRQKRSVSSEGIPTQYQYGFGQGSDNIWNLPQNSKWSNPKEDATNNHNYQGYTPFPIYKRLDTSVAASSEAATTPAPAPPATSKLPELRQILKAAKPFVGSCIGSTTGCAMCVLVLGRLPLGAVPAACTGPCFVGTFGSCGSLLGRVFSETTVICTELFRQGLMDPVTFMADAEFGKQLHEQFPTTMQGYTLLATPLVEVMKTSPLVTRIVSFFALPWANHMKFLDGRTSQPSISGLIVHIIGFPICNTAGHLHSLYQHYQLDSIYNVWCIFALLTITILTLILILTKFDRLNQIIKYITNIVVRYWKQLSSIFN